VIAAVVLTFAAPEGMLEDCVTSVLAADGIDRVVVVDNGGRAADLVGALDRVEVVTTGRNLGYAAGMNVGIVRALAAGADAVLVLNDDLVVERDVVGPLTDELHDARVGAVQPKLLFAGSGLVNSVGVQLGRDGAGVDIGVGQPDGPAFTGPRDIEVFTGGAVLVTRAFLDDVSGFDERFFLYYEDVDLALRGREHGWRYRCAPASVVHHRGSATAAQHAVADVTAFHRERNRLWVLVRHRPWGDVTRGIWLSVRRLRHPPRLVHLRALVAGIAAAPRLVRDRFRSA
jgi:GT2 family glycosyltransferase